MMGDDPYDGRDGRRDGREERNTERDKIATNPNPYHLLSKDTVRTTYRGYRM